MHIAHRSILLVALLALAACRREPSAPSAAAAPAVPRNVLLRQAIEALQAAQRNGDVGLHVRADRIATELIGRDPGDAVALTLRATARAGQHRFDEAVEWADKALALNPDDPAPYAVLTDALVELGDYERAVDTAQYLLELKPTHLAYARAAYLRVLYGDQAGGLRLMRLAADAAPPNEPAARAWYLGRLGQDALAAGENETAARAFRDALALRPDDARSLEGLAALAAAHGDTDRAIALYERVIAGGLAPDAHAALMDIDAALGRDDQADRHFAAAERGARLAMEAGGQPEERPLAMLYADRSVHLEEARRLAERAADRRDDIYTADTLGWVLFRSGQFSEAREAARRALRLGTRDPLLLYHAGLIAATAGDPAGAAGWLAAALERPAVLGPVRVQDARAALARLHAVAPLPQSTAHAPATEVGALNAPATAD